MKTHILLALFSLLLLASCKDGISFDDSLKNVEEKRAKVVAITTLDLTSVDHYTAITDYFRTVTDLALSLKSDPKAQKYWNSQVKAKKLTNFCSKYILTVDFWKSLNGQCSVDGQYLCPDEVREYPAILNVVLKNSPQSLKDDFEADGECSKWKDFN